MLRIINRCASSNRSGYRSGRTADSSRTISFSTVPCAPICSRSLSLCCSSGARRTRSASIWSRRRSGTDETVDGPAGGDPVGDGPDGEDPAGCDGSCFAGLSAIDPQNIQHRISIVALINVDVPVLSSCVRRCSDRFGQTSPRRSDRCARF